MRNILINLSDVKISSFQFIFQFQAYFFFENSPCFLSFAVKKSINLKIAFPDKFALFSVLRWWYRNSIFRRFSMMHNETATADGSVLCIAGDAKQACNTKYTAGAHCYVIAFISYLPMRYRKSSNYLIGCLLKPWIFPTKWRKKINGFDWQPTTSSNCSAYKSIQIKAMNIDCYFC